MSLVLNLDKIVYVICRNVQPRQIDKFGRCFTEEDIKEIQEDIKTAVRGYHSKDAFSTFKIISLIQSRVKFAEGRLDSTPALLAEYGM